ncbi:MAG: T9SS type A sorting domain-containing protein [Rhodothermaceae bacterium]|nr:T9SS type A sorting domain-containing protein [Rhodothermaceae bacterium]
MNTPHTCKLLLMCNQINPDGLFGWFLVSRFWFLVEKQVFTLETTRNKKPETRNRSHQFARIYVIALFSLLLTVPATAQLIIDDFDDEHSTPAMSINIATDAAILGGEREVDNTNNSVETSNGNSELIATLSFFNSVRLVYDGSDGDTENIDYEGLDGLDLASTSDALVISGVQTLQASVTIDIALYTTEGHSSFVQQTLDAFLEPVNLTVPFSEFSVLEGDGADLSSIGAIEIVVTGNGGTIFIVNSLGFSDTPLPVELTAFTAVENETDVTLSWETASELNNAGFYIEHLRPQSSDYEQIGFVEGQGTIDTAQYYRYLVQGLAAGVHRFRLKQVDFDGTFEYSPVVEISVRLASTYHLSNAYPNPFNPQSAFTLTVSRDQEVRITLHDLLGKEVGLIHSGLMEGQQEQQFLIDGSGLPSGTYLYRVSGEFFSASGRVLLVK